MHKFGTDEFISLTADRLQQVTTKLRFYFQKALLGWFKGEHANTTDVASDGQSVQQLTGF